LKSNGFEVWIDQHDFHGYLDESTKDAVMDCDIFVACVSPAYEKSENCMAEMRMATDDKKTIIPVKVKDFTVEKTKLRKGSPGFMFILVFFINCLNATSLLLS